MKEFTVRKGKTYRARITLTFLQSWTDNGAIADKLRLIGFIDVSCWGTGYHRVAEGTWVGKDTTGGLPPQVTEVVEM